MREIAKQRIKNRKIQEQQSSARSSKQTATSRHLVAVNSHNQASALNAAKISADESQFDRIRDLVN